MEKTQLPRKIYFAILPFWPEPGWTVSALQGKDVVKKEEKGLHCRAVLSSYYRLFLPQPRWKWLMPCRHFLVQVNKKKRYNKSLPREKKKLPHLYRLWCNTMKDPFKKKKIRTRNSTLYLNIFPLLTDVPNSPSSPSRFKLLYLLHTALNNIYLMYSMELM